MEALKVREGRGARKHTGSTELLFVRVFGVTEMEKEKERERGAEKQCGGEKRRGDITRESDLPSQSFCSLLSVLCSLSALGSWLLALGSLVFESPLRICPHYCCRRPIIRTQIPTPTIAANYRDGIRIHSLPLTRAYARACCSRSRFFCAVDVMVTRSHAPAPCRCLGPGQPGQPGHASSIAFPWLAS